MKGISAELGPSIATRYFMTLLLRYKGDIRMGFHYWKFGSVPSKDATGDTAR
jgi:hypothetical protein